MDGNRRFARKKNMECLKGHMQGFNKLAEVKLFCKFVLWNVPSGREDVFFNTQYVSCFFHTRHYVGVNIWTSKRLQSMPLALRTLSAQKKKLMDLWNWPGRNLPNCWRSGKYWVPFLVMIWWIVKSCTCHRRQLLYTITLTTEVKHYIPDCFRESRVSGLLARILIV